MEDRGDSTGGAVREQPVDLVFEGGGVKGVGLAGAFGALWKARYRPNRVAGTSAGAITAALVAAGYTGPELEQIVLSEMSFPDFADRSAFGDAGSIVELVRRRGLHSGDYFLHWMTKKLEAKGITQFGDLKSPDDTGVPSRQHRLQVIASDLSARSMLVLPRDASAIGVPPDRLNVAEAVRMSMSIPGFFDPVTRRDHHDHDHTIVDGGLLSNYPIWLFDRPRGDPPACPTFGMLLVAPGQRAPLLPHPTPAEAVAPVSNPIQFGGALIETMMEAHDRLYVELADYARTIPIQTLGVKTTDFAITDEAKRNLYDSGAAAVTTFLDSWRFAEYIAAFRSGPVSDRRTRALQTMRDRATGR